MNNKTKHKEKIAAAWLEAAELVVLPLYCVYCDFEKEDSEFLCDKCDQEMETRFSFLQKIDDLGAIEEIDKKDIENQFLVSESANKDKIKDLIDAYFYDREYRKLN